MPDLSYELIKESMKHSASGEELFQIKAVRDIPGASVKKGDLGGWIGKYAKLLDDAWISGAARVYGNALVHGNARISGAARVHGNALVYGDDIIKGGNGLVNIINPSGYSITVTKKYFYVGCRQFPIGSIQKNLFTIAIRYGFSESQYKNYKRVIRSAMKLINIEDN